MRRRFGIPAAGFAAALALAGCSSADATGEVSGRVTFAGKPLTAGRVVFTNEQDTAVASGYLTDAGTYAIREVPAGRVRVTVRTEEFKNTLSEKTVRMLQAKGVPVVLPKRPGVGTRYVPIPKRYADREGSGLSFDVKPYQANEFHIDLVR